MFCTYAYTPNKQDKMIHNEEILEEILSRLPAKSIGRFRCVSKPWRALLSQPHFIKTHLNRIKDFPFEAQSLILVTSQSNIMYTTQLRNAHHMLDEMITFATEFGSNDYLFGFSDDLSDIECFVGKMASCDGLTLIEDGESSLLLINPTTKEFEGLPKSPDALEPRDSFTMYGMGYDSVSDDYKIVALSYFDTDNEHEPDCTEMFVDVYSIKKGTWKRAVSSPYDHSVGHVTSGVFVDGHIHWLASKTSDYSSVIVAFDLGEEKFGEVPPPSLVEDSEFVFSHLLMLKGCLCMFASSSDYKTDIWLMKEYGVKESWTKFKIIDTDKSEFRPLCFVGMEQVVGVKDEERLVMYDLKEGRCNDIVVENIPEEYGFGGTFIESLVSPQCNVEATRND